MDYQKNVQLLLTDICIYVRNSTYYRHSYCRPLTYGPVAIACTIQDAGIISTVI